MLRTDHSSLTWLKNFTRVEGILARWIMDLDVYDYTIEHRKGIDHANADAMTRRTKPTRSCGNPDCVDCKPLRNKYFVASINARKGVFEEDWGLEDLRKWQREDPALKPIIMWLENSEVRPTRQEIAQYSYEVKSLWNQWENLVLRGGILYRIWYPQNPTQTENPVHQLVAPFQIRTRIMLELHDGLGGGHLGREKTVGKVRQRYYWVGYQNDVHRWCSSCDICAAQKAVPPRSKAKLKQFRAGHPMELIAVDIMGPWTETANGNKYVLVISDYFTKWTEAFALSSHTAPVVAEKIVEEFMFRYGIARQLHSDQGSEFDSDLVREVSKLLRCRKTRTTAYHPQSDGQVERCNRTIRDMITKAIHDAPDHWDTHLNGVCFAYRASVHATTKCTPNLLMLNREIDLPIDLLMPPDPDFDEPKCPVKYVEWVRQALRYAGENARQHTRMNMIRQKRNYDVNAGSPEFKVGDSVRWFYPPEARKKHGRKWHGPYLIIEKLDDVQFKDVRGYPLSKLGRARGVRDRMPV